MTWAVGARSYFHALPSHAAQQGQAVFNGAQVVYTANPGFFGTDDFKYTVANVLGTVSNEATVTVTVLCAGGTATIIECGQ